MSPKRRSQKVPRDSRSRNWPRMRTFEIYRRVVSQTNKSNDDALSVVFVSFVLPPSMLSLARSALRPTLTRCYAGRLSASIHTLPDLPYAYNVYPLLPGQHRTDPGLGIRTLHLEGNHGTTPHKAPPSLRQWPQRRRGSVFQDRLY